MKIIRSKYFGEKFGFSENGEFTNSQDQGLGLKAKIGKNR